MKPGLTPVLPALHVRGRTVSQLVVWCVHCRTGHWHGGLESFGDGDGHRVAHCVNRGSAYLATGYDLREVSMTHPDMAPLLAYLKRERLTPTDRGPGQ